jgi:hypothetical protein
MKAASGCPAATASASHAATSNPRERHAYDALHADQREALGERGKLRLGLDALALHQPLDLAEHPAMPTAAART